MQTARMILFFLIFCFYSLAVYAECNQRIVLSKPYEKYEDLHNGIVVDQDTGLEWKKCSAGLSGDSCGNGTVLKVHWLAALNIANDENFQGFEDWRLPNKKELASLVEKACFSPAINQGLLPATQWDIYWTSSPYAGINENAWVVDFSSGYSEPLIKSDLAYVRLVRGGY